MFAKCEHPIRVCANCKAVTDAFQRFPIQIVFYETHQQQITILSGTSPFIIKPTLFSCNHTVPSINTIHLLSRYVRHIVTTSYHLQASHLTLQSRTISFDMVQHACF